MVAENLANRDSTGEAPGADPYRRKTVTFGARVDRALGAETVEVRRIGTAPASSRRCTTRPSGRRCARLRQAPNVDSLVEMMDMREAQRSYSANLSVLEITRGMLTRTIEAWR